MKLVKSRIIVRYTWPQGGESELWARSKEHADQLVSLYEGRATSARVILLDTYETDVTPIPTLERQGLL